MFSDIFSLILLEKVYKKKGSIMTFPMNKELKKRVNYQIRECYKIENNLLKELRIVRKKRDFHQRYLQGMYNLNLH